MSLSRKLSEEDGNKLVAMRVLLVDDHPHIRSIISGILNALNVSNVDTAERGDTALRMLSSGNYDLLITDFEMPGMTGIDLARTLRKDARAAQPKPCFDIPILMITSNITRQRLKEVRDAGIDEILAKPFTITAVADRLNAIISNRREFIVCHAFTGPCRRRVCAADYKGPKRRDADLEHLPELEAVQELALLQHDARTMLKLAQDCERVSSFEQEVVVATALQIVARAKRLRSDLLQRAAQSLVKYVQWATGTVRVDARVVESHAQALVELVELGDSNQAISAQVVVGLETAVTMAMTSRVKV